MPNSTLPEIQNVLICEDHPFIQKGIEVALKELLPNVRGFMPVKKGEEALEYARSYAPELAFVDLDLPGISGVTVIERLKEMSPDTRVFVVTSCSNPGTLKKVRRLGVSAIIQKIAAEECLGHAMENLNQKLPYLDPHTRRILKEYEEIRLTPREEEVLQEIIQGLSNQKIAQRLGCGLTTVRFHRANIMQKTGMHSAAELTAWYLKGQRNCD